MRELEGSFLAGAMNASDTIESDAGNRMGVFNRDLEFVDLFQDPRDDSAVFGNLDMQSGPIATISAQYAVTKIFLIEASVGYQVSDLGDVEVSAQFENARTPIEEINFAFETFRINAGEITRVPIQLTALARLRPRAKFNPYFGAGLGYAVQGYDPSDEFNQLSVNMDRSLGRAQRLTSSFGGDASLLSLLEVERMTGVLDVRGPGTGWMQVREGRVVAASQEERGGSLRSIEAVHGMLGWTTGLFEFHAQAVTAEDEVGATTTRILLGEARQRGRAESPSEDE